MDFVFHRALLVLGIDVSRFEDFGFVEEFMVEAEDFFVFSEDRFSLWSHDERLD